MQGITAGKKTTTSDTNDQSNINISDSNDLSNVDISDVNDPSNIYDLGANKLADDEYRVNTDDKEMNFREKILITDIDGLAEMCNSKCGTKYLSTLLYMS